MDALKEYEKLVGSRSPDTIAVTVRRIEPMSNIGSPRADSELLDALSKLHGRRNKTKYRVNFADAASGTYLGRGVFEMPDTRAGTLAWTLEGNEGLRTTSIPWRPTTAGTPRSGDPGRMSKTSTQS